MGYLGVQLFFVISGLVICRQLLREETRNGKFSLKAFYIRRAFRILPPLYFYLGVLAILTWFGVVQIALGDFIKATFFFADFHSLSAPWFTGHTWSLAVEEQFYFFFPFILFLTPHRWRVAVCSSICALFIAGTVAASSMRGAPPLTPAVIVGFVFIFYGVLIALNEERAREMTRNVPAIVVVLAGTLLLLQPAFHLNFWMLAFYEGLCVPPVVAVMLLSTLDRPSWISSFLRWGPVQRSELRPTLCTYGRSCLQQGEICIPTTGSLTFFRYCA